MERLFGAGLVVLALMLSGCQENTVAEPSPLEMEPASASSFEDDYYDEPASSTDEEFSYTGERVHEVVRKDTLYSLAKRYYGDGKKWPTIQDANPGVVPERLRVGQKLIIPAQ